MLNKLNNTLLAVFTLVGFAWLAWTSLHVEPAYNHSIFEVLRPKYNEQQARTIMEVWHITQDDLESKVDIFGE